MTAETWFFLIFVFFFGVLAGWLLQRRNGDASPDVREQQANLDRLEEEIAAAKQRLAENEKESAEMLQGLLLVDQAVKDADARLSAMARATSAKATYEREADD